MAHPMVNLEDTRLPGLPPSFYYIPDFITVAEEEDLLSKIRAQRWIALSRRRLQVYPAQLSSKNTLLAATPIPSWLTHPIAARFEELGIFDKTLCQHGGPNHVLVNEYPPGIGIMPHEDGPAYAPIVATVSLGAPIVLDVYDQGYDGKGDKKARWRILQEERSLLVTKGEAYDSPLMHGISEVDNDEELHEKGICNWDLLGNRGRFEDGRWPRGERISLTYRDVLKVSKLGAKLFGKR